MYAIYYIVAAAYIVFVKFLETTAPPTTAEPNQTEDFPLYVIIVIGAGGGLVIIVLILLIFCVARYYFKSSKHYIAYAEHIITTRLNVTLLIRTNHKNGHHSLSYS